MLVVSPNCTCDDVASKYSPIMGRLGRYMSVTKGPKAVSMPSNTSMKTLELSFFIPITATFYSTVQSYQTSDFICPDILQLLTVFRIRLSWVLSSGDCGARVLCHRPQGQMLFGAGQYVISIF